MMLHPVLEKLIKEELSMQPEMQGLYKEICEKISNYFYSYERDIKMLEHASNIAHEDYEKINARLSQLNKQLEEIAKQKTIERDIMAQFPFENPSPVLRIDEGGNIEYMNPSAQKLEDIEYNKKSYKPQDFFRAIGKRLQNVGQLEFIWSGKNYLFNYKNSRSRKN